MDLSAEDGFLNPQNDAKATIELPNAARLFPKGNAQNPGFGHKFMRNRLRKLAERVREATQDPFRNTVFNAQKFERIMSWPEPDRRYVIFFTPRSGSSRLTDLAKNTKALGDPGECFNPSFIPDIGKAYSARNMDEYVDLLLRMRQTKGVFGCEVTHTHVVKAFRKPARFLEAIRPTSTIWLIREDILAQAVSISRMMQTKVSHTAHADDEQIAVAEQVFTYNSRQIASALQRLRYMEAGTEETITRHGLIPLRLSYEQTISMRPKRLMAVIARHVGARQLDLDALETGHRKVSGDKSNDFAERFRRENMDLVAQIEQDRAPMLAKHAAARVN